MLNKVQLIGNLGSDPEIIVLNNGDKLAKLQLATTEKWRDNQGNKQETTTWHRVVVWKRLAEIVEKYTQKGSRVFVEGKIQNGSYEDKDGITRYTTDIVASQVILLGSPRSSQNGQENTPQRENSPNPTPPQSQSANEDEDDDLPF